MKKISSKLLVLILSLFTVVMAVMLYINYSISVNSLKENNEKASSELAVQTAKMFDIWVEARKNEISSLAKNPTAKLVSETMSEEDVDKQIEFLKEQKEVYGKDYDIFFIAKTDGSYHSSDGRQPGNLSERAYWKPVMSGQVVASDPVVSKSTGNVVSVIIAPIKDDSGKVIGALAGNVLINNIKNLISMENGVAYITNSKGLIIVHKDDKISRTLDLTKLDIKLPKDDKAPNYETLKKQYELIQELKLSEKQKESLNELGKKMIAAQKSKVNLNSLKSSDLDLDKYSHEYDFRGDRQRAVFLPINNNSWTVSVAIPLSLIDNEAKNQALVSIQFFVVSTGIVVIIVLIFVNTFTRPINALNVAVEKIAAGSLAEKIHIRSQDEIGNLAKNVNKMIDHLRSMVVNINQSSGDVALSSQQLFSTVTQTSSSIQEITRDLSSINEEVIKSSRIMHDAASIVSEVSQSAYHVAQSCNEANEKSSLTVNSAIEGGKALEQAEESMRNMVNSMENISKAINTLNDSSKRISDIIEVISAIADQTNLLALNAAIEAARAGEHGRGFAVVAEEIRKLAEQSNISTNEIKGIINLTLTNTKNSVNAINEGNTAISEEKEKFAILRNHFNNIVENSKMVASAIENIASSAEEQSAQSQEINSTMKEVRDLIDSTSENTSSLNATVEEQSAMLQELNATAEKLHNMAEELDDTVKVFKL